MNRRDRKTAERWMRSHRKSAVIISPKFFNGGGVDEKLVESLSTDFYLWPMEDQGIYAIWKENPNATIVHEKGIVCGYVRRESDVIFLGGEGNFSFLKK
jgi:hypothetical protein